MDNTDTCRRHTNGHGIGRGTRSRVGRIAWPLAAAVATALGMATASASASASSDERSPTLSTAEATGVSDPLGFVLSEHFPVLSDYSGFEADANANGRCLIISPLPCD